MNQIFKVWVLGAALAVSATSVQAGGGATTNEVKKSDTDPFVQGYAEKAETAKIANSCNSCHGKKGRGNKSKSPKLAGQSAKYIYAQLQAFKNRTRKNSQMTGQIDKYTDQQLRDLSAFFAAQPAKIGAANEELAVLGEEIYRAGNETTGVPACTGCHGPRGNGNAAAGYPALSGQFDKYVVAQLKKYRSADRYIVADEKDLEKKFPLAKVMYGVAKNMTDAEIDAVSSYIQGLHSENRK